MILDWAKSMWQRYMVWIHTPMRTPPLSEKQCVCLNCDESYDGDFCPRCGQPATAQRFTFTHVMKQALDVWGLGGRKSMPRTVWHLLWRPGYMIADYLRGHRQPYFSPFKMLMLVTTAFAIFVHVMPGVNVNSVDWEGLVTKLEHNITEDRIDDEGDEVQAATKESPAQQEQKLQQVHFRTMLLKKVLHWVDTHDIISTLLYHLTMTFIVVFVFRKTPNLGRATNVEHFYAQVFIASQMTIVATFSILIDLLFDGSASADMPIAITLVLFVIDYHQLYGFGWVKTFFKTLLSQILYLLTIAILLVLGGVMYYLAIR